MTRPSSSGGRRRGSGEGSISQRSDGRWQVQIDLGWSDGKRQRPTRYAGSQKKAISVLTEMRRRAAEGRPPTDSAQPLGAWIDWWLANVVEASTLAETTKASYRAEATKHVKADLGHHRLDRLRAQHIAEWLATMARQANQSPKGTPSTNTRRLRLAALRSALNVAVDYGLLAANPARQVKSPQPKRDETKVHHLSLEEAQSLLDAAVGTRNRALWMMLIVMGLRRGEVLGLRWLDIDFNQATLQVEQSLSRVSGKGLLLHPPKSSATRRSCPIPLILVEALQAHWAEQEVERLEAKTQVSDSGLVFTTAAGRPIEPSGLSRQFGTLCKHTGLRHERIHNLRHTAATIMRVHGGADLLDVSRLLGHSSIRVTADLYGHTLPSTQSQIANRVGDLFTH